MTKPLSNEFKAIKAIDDSFATLTDAECKRVLDWAQQRYVGSILDVIVEKEQKARGEAKKTTDAYFNFMEGLQAHFREVSERPLLDLIQAADVIVKEAKKIQGYKAEQS